MANTAYRFVLSELIKPMMHRVGSAAGVYLAAAGVFAAGEIETIETALTLLGGYAIDLVIRKVL